VTILNRTKPADVDPDDLHPSWPRDWANPKSDFYIDPVYRDDYKRSTKGDREQLRNLSPYPATIVIRGKARSVEPLRGGSDEELFLHAKALAAAAQAVAGRRDQAEREAYRQKTYACAVDGVPEELSRIIGLPGMTRPARVCGPHEVVLRARSARWVAEQEVSAGRTVGVVIDAMFETTKARAS
jgi:hypothetical protein